MYRTKACDPLKDCTLSTLKCAIYEEELGSKVLSLAFNYNYGHKSRNMVIFQHFCWVKIPDIYTKNSPPPQISFKPSLNFTLINLHISLLFNLNY